MRAEGGVGMEGKTVLSEKYRPGFTALFNVHPVRAIVPWKARVYSHV